MQSCPWQWLRQDSLSLEWVCMSFNRMLHILNRCWNATECWPWASVYLEQWEIKILKPARLRQTSAWFNQLQHMWFRNTDKPHKWDKLAGQLGLQGQKCLHPEDFFLFLPYIYLFISHLCIVFYINILRRQEYLLHLLFGRTYSSVLDAIFTILEYQCMLFMCSNRRNNIFG